MYKKLGPKRKAKLKTGICWQYFYKPNFVYKIKSNFVQLITFQN